jgi:alkylated DNA repair dioxygenase AlkB
MAFAEAVPTAGRDGMMDLFNETRRLCLADAEVEYHPAPDLGASPDDLFQTLRSQLTWEQHYVRIQDQTIPQPRLSSWHGEVVHSYSTLAHVLIPHPWSPLLLRLRNRVETITGARFNSMLANLYRDGDDAIGWHSDDEPELGPRPLIASLSFGAERRFSIRRRDDHAQVTRLSLGHGSLLVMGGRMQHHWQHALPRTRSVTGERINLTFRLTQPR